MTKDQQARGHDIAPKESRNEITATIRHEATAAVPPRCRDFSTPLPSFSSLPQCVFRSPHAASTVPLASVAAFDYTPSGTPVRNMRMPPSAPPRDLPHPESVPRHAVIVHPGRGKRVPSLSFQPVKSLHSLSRQNPRSSLQGSQYPSSHSLTMDRSHGRRLSPLPSRTRRSIVDSFGALLTIVFACLLIRPTSAVLIPFDNCLPDSYRNFHPLPLQWSPVYVDARFDTENPDHLLQIIVWGNVSGSLYKVDLPAKGDPLWNDSTHTDGKILDYTREGNKVTTLASKVNFLTYEPFSNVSSFCNYSLVNGSCPLSPVFNDTAM